MSFRCYYTGKVAPPGTRAVKVIVEVRRKEYPFRPKAIPVRRKGRKRKQYKDDKGGMGWERVKEVMMTPEGARMFAESQEGQTLAAQMEAWRSGPMLEEERAALRARRAVEEDEYEDEEEEDDDE